MGINKDLEHGLLSDGLGLPCVWESWGTGTVMANALNPAAFGDGISTLLALTWLVPLSMAPLRPCILAFSRWSET